jgi:hypothetical protein
MPASSPAVILNRRANDRHYSTFYLLPGFWAGNGWNWAMTGRPAPVRLSAAQRRKRPFLCSRDAVAAAAAIAEGARKIGQS